MCVPALLLPLFWLSMKRVINSASSRSGSRTSIPYLNCTSFDRFARPATTSYQPGVQRILWSSRRTFATSPILCKTPIMTDVEKQFHDNTANGTGGLTNNQHPASHQISDSTEGQQAWKKRAPYRIHDSNEHFQARYDASCHCGRVHYELSREEPLDSKLCHCTTCQKQHGGYTVALVTLSPQDKPSHPIVYNIELT